MQKSLSLTNGLVVEVIVEALMLPARLWRAFKYRKCVTRNFANSIPVELCRQILRKDCGFTDAALVLLRDQMEALARVVVEALPRQRQGNASQQAPDAARQAVDGGAKVEEPPKQASFPDAFAELPDSDRYDVAERAAIMEFDGGLDRDTAERAAFNFYWRSKHKGN